ncbi:MAG: NAD(P)H-dependent oxidoreductase subunit E [Magnetococcus sp. YQC-5]
MLSEFHAKLFERLVDVGEPTFNMAHERLLSLIVDADLILGSAIAAGVSLTVAEWNAVGDIFNELIVYTKQHFTEEIQYLRARGYPEVDRHQALHDEIVGGLQIFHQRVIQYDDASMGKIRRWMLAWLLGHVNTRDSEYARYFSQIDHQENPGIKTVVRVCVQEHFANRPSCAQRGGEQLADALEGEFAARSLDVDVERVYCFGRCQEGPNMRIFPRGAFFTGMTQKRLEEIVDAVQSSLSNG